MQPLHLFELANRQAQWLSVRQSTIAGNIANVNTPDFRARDVETFNQVLDQTHLGMAATNAAHLEVGATGIEAVTIRNGDVTDKNHSGNTVNLEEELMKSGEINREFSLNTSIVKAFHRMMLSSVKG